MNIKTHVIGVSRENRDGSNRQQIISRLHNDEEVFLYDAATERNPLAIAVINYDNQLFGFLDKSISRAIRKYTNAIGDIVAYVNDIRPDREGLLQCEIELEIDEASNIGMEYAAITGISAPDAPAARRRPRQNTYTEDSLPSRQRTNETRLICPRCGSTNINVQMVSETNLKTKRHSIFWWLLIGWWWIPFKWIVFTIPALFIKIFAPKKYKTTTTHRSMVVCQNCGNNWQAS